MDGSLSQAVGSPDMSSAPTKDLGEDPGELARLTGRSPELEALELAALDFAAVAFVLAIPAKPATYAT